MNEYRFFDYFFNHKPFSQEEKDSLHETYNTNYICSLNWETRENYKLNVRKRDNRTGAQADVDLDACVWMMKDGLVYQTYNGGRANPQWTFVQYPWEKIYSARFLDGLSIEWLESQNNGKVYPARVFMLLATDPNERAVFIEKWKVLSFLGMIPVIVKLETGSIDGANKIDGGSKTEERKQTSLLEKAFSFIFSLGIFIFSLAFIAGLATYMGYSYLQDHQADVCNARTNLLKQDVVAALNIVSLQHPDSFGAIRGIFNDQGQLDKMFEDHAMSQIHPSNDAISCAHDDVNLIINSDSIRKTMAASMEKGFGLSTGS